jgi:hypothetical protein
MVSTGSVIYERDTIMFKWGCREWEKVVQEKQAGEQVDGIVGMLVAWALTKAHVTQEFLRLH